MAERFEITRRRALILGAAGALGAAGTVDALNTDGEDGGLEAGRMALNQAYKVADGVWIGPDSAKGTVPADSGNVFMAADTDVDYYGDGGTWTKRAVGSSTEPVPSVSTDEQNTTTKYVPNFGTFQAAHDDLPSDGGKIVITEDITETDVSISKPITIEGQGSGYFGAQGSIGPEDGTTINTDGGNGLHITSENVLIRDLQVVGDQTGGYGIRVGEPGTSVRGFMAENIRSSVNGTHGWLFEGQVIFNELNHVMADNNSQDGFHYDLASSDYFYANNFHTVTSQDNGRHGHYWTGSGGIKGNEWTGFVSQRNGNWGMLADNSDMGQNTWKGYGTENNGSSITLNTKGNALSEIDFRRTENSNFTDITFNGNGLVDVVIREKYRTKTLGPNKRVLDLNGGVLVGGNQNELRLSNGTIKTDSSNLEVGGSYLGFTGSPNFQVSTAYQAQSSAPSSPIEGEVALSDGTNWDPDSDGNAELLIYNGSSWLEIVDMGTTF